MYRGLWFQSPAHHLASAIETSSCCSQNTDRNKRQRQFWSYYLKRIGTELREHRGVGSIVAKIRGRPLPADGGGTRDGDDMEMLPLLPFEHLCGRSHPNKARQPTADYQASGDKRCETMSKQQEPLAMQGRLGKDLTP